MDFFDSKKNVLEYIKMCDGFDGRELIEILKTYVPLNSTILEIGSGPGKDLDLLNDYYYAVGSDRSEVFKELYLKEHENANYQILDAVTLNTDKKYDCIYSNKVLHHLTKEELLKSFKRQKEIIKKGGVLFHSFWKGDKQEEFDGLFFQYYLEEQLENIVKDNFQILKIESYKEFEENDSIYLILKN